MKRLLMLASLVVLTVVSSGPLLAQSNPQIGTWKLNVAKSKYVNVQGPKSGTRTVEAQGDGAKVTTEGVAGDGSRIAYSFTTNFDGKDSAISGVGAPGGEDVVAIKRVDANTSTGMGKKAGKMIRTVRFVVSNDGKVLTVTVKGSNEQGLPVSIRQVWEKQ
jgi:hypothetical protein